MHAAAGSENPTDCRRSFTTLMLVYIYMKPRMNVFGLDRAMFDVRLGHYWYYCTFCRRVLDRLGSLSRAVTCSLPPSSYLHTLLMDPLAVSKKHPASKSQLNFVPSRHAKPLVPQHLFFFFEDAGQPTNAKISLSAGNGRTTYFKNVMVA